MTNQIPRSLEEAEGLLRRSRAYLGIAAEMGLNGYHEYDSGLVEEVDAYLLARPASDVPSGGPAAVKDWTRTHGGWKGGITPEAPEGAYFLTDSEVTAWMNSMGVTPAAGDSEWCEEHDWLASIYSGDLKDVIAERCRNCTAIQWNGEVFADAWNALAAIATTHAAAGGRGEGLVEGWKNDKNLVRRNGWNHVFAFTCESDTQAAYAASLLQNRDETIAALEARLNALTAPSVGAPLAPTETDVVCPECLRNCIEAVVDMCPNCHWIDKGAPDASQPALDGGR